MSPTPEPSRRILITAGPTHEPIDPVRYLANRSSGRMGLALAEAAAERNWPTTLLLGPTPLPPPERSIVRTLRFQTTEQLGQLLTEQWPAHDVLLMAAAVADFRVAGNPGDDKLRRSDEPLTLHLQPTPDLIAQSAATRRSGQVIIGFALEAADELEASARDKLQRKGVDAIVANPLETMDSTEITATLFLRDGRTIPAPARVAKPDFACWLLDQLPAIASGAGFRRI